MIRALLSFAILLLVSTTCFGGGDKNYIIHQQYFEDKSNSLNFDQVKSEQFVEYEGLLARGYSPSTYWIKLTIGSSADDLILRIRPAYVENIELFDSFSSDKRITGSRYPWSNSDVSSFSHNFRLAGESRERQIFLRIKNERSYLVGLDVMTQSEYVKADRIESVIDAGYIAVTLLLALGLAAAWITNHEVVVGVFAIQQFIAFFHTVLVLGFARVFLDGFIDVNVINYIFYIVIVIYPLVGILANKLLFSEYGLKRLYGYIFNGLLITSMVIIGLLLLGKINYALKINAQLVLLTVITFFVTSWFGTKHDETSKKIKLPIKVIQIYYSFNLVMWCTSVLPLLGIIKGEGFSMYFYLLYNVLGGLILFSILQYRARLIFKNEIIQTNKLRDEFKLERARREEQNKLMSMLSHEIKTPLSILRLVLDLKVSGTDLEGYANRAVNNINSVVDKFIQLDEYDSNILKIHKSNFNFVDLLNSVISDTHSDASFQVNGISSLKIYSDIQILRIILSNLISNALKYSPEKSEIVLSFNLMSDTVNHLLSFSIQNQIGDVEPPYVERVFEKYYRSPSATKVSGTGLGLFLTRELVMALNGDIKCTLVKNSILFSVCLPV